MEGIEKKMLNFQRFPDLGTICCHFSFKLVINTVGQQHFDSKSELINREVIAPRSYSTSDKYFSFTIFFFGKEIVH